ncbi:MAG TPA: hypothetical protein VGJ26_13890 [Pirellulales bacterium]|jgi:hypothetical protein
MSIEPAAELFRFQQFIRDHLAKGEAMSPEEALDLWRIENPDPGEHADVTNALREALSDMEAGDCGVPLEEFDRAFRRRHGIPF